MNSIFPNQAFISAEAARNYAAALVKTHPSHMDPPDSPYFGTGRKAIELERTIGAEGVTRADTFQHAMLQALDDVSGAQHYASALQVQAFVNPDSVDIHDITVAQATASMTLEITRNIMNRVVQSWRDLINTR